VTKRAPPRGMDDNSVISMSCCRPFRGSKLGPLAQLSLRVMTCKRKRKYEPVSCRVPGFNKPVSRRASRAAEENGMHTTHGEKNKLCISMTWISQQSTMSLHDRLGCRNKLPIPEATSSYITDSGLREESNPRNKEKCECFERIVRITVCSSACWRRG